MHHRLGYDLPERTGFGGLWAAIDEAAVDEDGAAVRRPTAGEIECEPTLVAVSDGPSSPVARRAVDAFRRFCSSQPRVAA
jgi:hypothetical protein